MSQRSRHGCSNGGSHRKCGESIQITEIGPQMVGHSCKDPPSPSNYCIFWMSCFLKSRLFAKIPRFAFGRRGAPGPKKLRKGAISTFTLPKSYGRGRDFIIALVADMQPLISHFGFHFCCFGCSPSLTPHCFPTSLGCIAESVG